MRICQIISGACRLTRLDSQSSLSGVVSDSWKIETCVFYGRTIRYVYRYQLYVKISPYLHAMEYFHRLFGIMDPI